MSHRWITLSTALALLLAAASAPARGPNVLLVVADDVSTLEIGGYRESPDAAHTPVLDGLIAAGVRFTRAYANPICSSSRAALLTGRYSFRTGMGHIADFPADLYALPLAEVLLPEVLPARRRAAFGKWHLAGGPEQAAHPLQQGFGHFAGTQANLNDYFDWRYHVDGRLAPLPHPLYPPHPGNYATSVNVDDFIAWLDTLGDDPWFAYLAFNAPHKPFHAPPDHLHTYELGDTPDDRTLYKAMLEALDTELGRALSHVDLSETTVIFCADNGVPSDVIAAPYPAYDPGPPDNAHGKLTTYDGGVRVPLIIAGAGVPTETFAASDGGITGAATTTGGVCDALVQLTDVFQTVVELTGAAAADPTDSLSLVPYLRTPSRPSLRPIAYSEYFQANQGPTPNMTGVWAVRDERFKLIRNYERYDDPSTWWDEVYDLKLDPLEQLDLLLLLPDPPTHEQLDEALDALLDSSPAWAD